MVEFLQLDETRLAYSEVGSGPPVVWLHGSGPGATGLSNFGGNLAGFADYRNIVIDLPGWGESNRASDEWLLFAAADIVHRAMNELGVPHAHMICNSYGGGVAMRLAITRPEVVDRLVLMAQVVCSPMILRRGRLAYSVSSITWLMRTPRARRWANLCA